MQASSILLSVLNFCRFVCVWNKRTCYVSQHAVKAGLSGHVCHLELLWLDRLSSWRAVTTTYPPVLSLSHRAVYFLLMSHHTFYHVIAGTLHLLSAACIELMRCFMAIDEPSYYDFCGCAKALHMVSLNVCRLGWCVSMHMNSLSAPHHDGQPVIFLYGASGGAACSQGGARGSKSSTLHHRCPRPI